MRFNILLLLGFFAFAACSKEGEVEVVNTNLETQTSLRGFLSFEFNKPLVSDTAVHQWGENDLLKFEPNVPGRIRWSSSTELEFHPESQFKPATTYRITLKDELLKKYNYSGFSSGRELVFSTPNLAMEQVLAFWQQQNGSIELKTEISLNYPVTLAEASEFFSFSLDGEEVAWQPINISGKTIEGVVKNVEAVDKDRQLQVRLKEGAVPASGQNGLETAQVEDFLLLSPFKIEVLSIHTDHNGVSGSVEIHFSQQVTERDIAKYFSLDPEVQFELNTADRMVVMRSDDFDPDKAYELTVSKGLKGKLGGVLRSDYVQDLNFGELQPDIRFTNRKAMYLGSKGNKNIEVQIVNIDQVEVKVYKIYPNNIQHYLQQGYYNDNWGDEYYNNYYSGDNIRPEDMGDVVFSSVIKTDSLPPHGAARIFNFNFEDKLPGYDGLMVLELRSTENYWNWASKVIAFSDIGLIAKVGEKTVTVFANSIRNAEPLNNVELTVLGRNNQKVGTAKTNSNGVAVVEIKNPGAENFEPGMVMAKNGADFSFLVLDRTDIQTSRYDVGGYRQSEAAYHTFTYGERDIYRPGETIHLVTIARTKDLAVPKDMPFSVVILGPDGREVARQRKTTNEQGSFEIAFPTLETAMTGGYNFQILGPTGVYLGAYNVAVEEFVPHRIKTTVHLEPEEPKAGDEVALNIEAVNLFGPPAANRNYQVAFNLRKEYFSPANFEGYSFDVANAEGDFREILVEGKTNAAGKARELFTISKDYRNMGMLRLEAYATVFDETGRPVNQLVTTRVATQPVFFGVKSPGTYFDVGAPVRFDLAAVDASEKLVSGQAKVQLVKIEYRTVLSRSGGYFRYNSERSEKVVEEKSLSVNENGTVSFTPQNSGSYEVRVFAKNSSTYVIAGFYAYGYGFTGNQSFMVNNEGRISIKTDKEKYAPGDKARVLFTTPFEGTLLITLERNEVLEHRYLKTANKAAELLFAIKEEYLPNVYISAVLFRPHENDGMPLTVAHGFEPLMVEKPSNKLGVEIFAEEKTGSSATQTITVKTSPGAWVSIAAVDEGILQVSGFETPDPYGEFYQKQALGVRTSDIYPFLFPEVSSRQFLRGGGAGLAKRLNPLGNRRFNLLSYWSGLQKADKRGEVRHTISIPHFSGRLRIMAVAHLNEKFGNAESSMIIADPLVVSTAFPRFLSPGDKIEVPLTITNSTAKAISAGIEISATGPVEKAASAEKSVSVQPTAEVQVPLQITADNRPGRAKLKVAVSGNKTYIQNIDFAVRPASPLQQRSGHRTVKPGSTAEVLIDTENFIEQSTDYSVFIASSPLAGIAGKLYELLHYPHGCTEQTTAAAFPQLYFAELTATLSGKNAQQAQANVKTAIEKLKAAQLYDGSFTYWPGEGTPNWWGSVFATHFLYEAREAGYEVPQKVLDNAAQYLLMRLQKREVVNYYYKDDQKYAPREVAYSLFVLAAMQKPSNSMMNYYQGNPQLLTDDARILLAGAYALNGNQKEAQKLLPQNPNLKSPQQTGGSFASTTRNLALSVYVLLKSDPDNAAIPELIRQLSQNVAEAKYMNTQETAFSTLALGLYAKNTAKGIPAGTVSAGQHQIADIAKKELRLTRSTLKSNKIRVNNTGDVPLFVFWQSEGISTDGSFVQEDKFLSVRRSYFSRSGGQVTNSVFRQNELIVVRIALQSLNGQTIENVAISDLLPAGLEIENARLTDNPDLNWIKNRSVPEYTDIRDDRMNLYDTATPETKYYYYMVRAVTKGEFSQGAIAAEAMYDGAIHSISGGGKVVVQ